MKGSIEQSSGIIFCQHNSSILQENIAFIFELITIYLVKTVNVKPFPQFLC